MDYAKQLRDAVSVSDAKLDQMTVMMSRYVAGNPPRFFEIYKTVMALMDGEETVESVSPQALNLIWSLAYVGARKVGHEACGLIAEAIDPT